MDQPVPYAKRQKVELDDAGGPRDYHPPLKRQKTEGTADEGRSTSFDPAPPMASTSAEQLEPSLEAPQEKAPEAAMDEGAAPVTEKKKELKGKARFPHGNYTSYYTKRYGSELPLKELDSRLARIPAAWFKGNRILDVGCNTGQVTIQIAQRLEPERVVGVDIDAVLIKQAKKLMGATWSMQGPSDRLLKAAEKGYEEGKYQQRRPRADEPIPDDANLVPPPSIDYFPRSMSRMFGYLPYPPGSLMKTYEEVPEVETRKFGARGRRMMPVERTGYPENIRLRQADWTQDDITDDRKAYHVILAFSVTKWIHLHGLNEGLFEFFKKVFECLLPGGKFIVEPQPFSSYARSARPHPQLKENMEALKVDGWKPENGDFERVLLDTIGFESKEVLTGEAATIKGFDRPVEVYHKRAGSYL